MRDARLREAGVDRAEPRANRLDRQVQQLREGRGDDQRDKRARYPRRDPRPDGDDRQRRNRDHQRPRVDRLKSVDVRVPLRQERRGHSLHLETEQVTDLAREDDQRDAARESDRHRVGNELDRGAEAEQAEGDEDEAGHERRDDEPVDAVLLHDSRHDHHERARRPPDLDARAAQQRDEETGDDGGIESALGTEPARDRERNRERQRDDADDDAGDQVPGKLLPVVVLDGGEKLGDEHGAEKILNSRMHSISALALLLTLQQPLPSDSAVRALLESRVKTFPDTGRHGEGIVVGLLDPSGARRIIAVGVDQAAVFEIGSITKTFTASILADMVDHGEVRLDDPVAKYLPPSVRVPSRNGKQITLLDLATQSSRLPRMPSNFTPKDSLNPYADYTVQQMYAFLSSYALTRDVGAEYEYSNLGVGLLGHALALKAGTSYEALVRQRILGPLGMHETAITLTPAMRARLAPGHEIDGRVVPNWDLPTFAGAGALRSTAADMLRFLIANLDSTAPPLGHVLRATHAARHATSDPNLRIGLAWHILSRPSGGIVWHNGGTGGHPRVHRLAPPRRGCAGGSFHTKFWGD